MELFTLEVQHEDSGSRLDRFLIAKLSQLPSRTYLKKIFSENKILVNNKPAKPNYKVKEHDKIFFEIPELKELEIQPENIPLDIIYEDDDLLVVNKPAGMVTHPAPGNYSGTLVNALVHYSKSLSMVGTPLRPGIVHRLDKDTSGTMVVAKNDKAHVKLAEQFKLHSIKRKYLAVVEGIVQFDEGVVDLPIGRHPLAREKMSVSFLDDSREAKTTYKTLKRYNYFSLIELSPHTGRTHQLRVHMAYLGHPIVGDKKYGKGKISSRLALHAQLIGFNHPRTGKYMEFSSDLPEEIKKIIKE